MAFTDRVVEHPGRVKLTNVSGDIYDITPYEGEVTAQGTLLNAANLNKETQLDGSVEDLFTAAGMTGGTYQNEMSDALKFTADKIIAEQITLTPVSPFDLYGITPITATRMGSMIVVSGVVKVTQNTVLDQTQRTICTLPEGWRPAYPVYAVTQSSGTSIALADITSAGQVRLGRLRDMASANGAYTTANTQMWFPFTLMFVTA